MSDKINKILSLAFKSDTPEAEAITAFLAAKRLLAGKIPVNNEETKITHTNDWAIKIPNAYIYSFIPNIILATNHYDLKIDVHDISYVDHGYSEVKFTTKGSQEKLRLLAAHIRKIVDIIKKDIEQRNKIPVTSSKPNWFQRLFIKKS